jgi:hypothetical protein
MLVFIAFEGKDAGCAALSQEIPEKKRVLTVPILGGRQGFLDHERPKAQRTRSACQEIPMVGELSRVNQGAPWASSAVFYATLGTLKINEFALKLKGREAALIKLARIAAPKLQCAIETC